MSPDSQRLEIEFLQSKIAHWRSQRPDFHERITSIVSVWLHPAMDKLDMSASQLKSAIESAPDGHSLLAWLAEESFSYRYDGTTLFEQYIQDAGRTDNGLHLRFMRRMANSTTTLWRVAEKPNPFSFIITPACGSGLSHTIHDRIFTLSVNTGDVLLTRFIDMPAGPILGQAVFNFGPFDETIVDMSRARVQRLLSAFASMVLQPPNMANDIGENDKGARHPHSNQKAHGRNPEFANHTEQPSLKPGHQNPADASDTQGNDSGAQERNRSSDSEETPAPHNSTERERLLERVRKLFAMAQQSDASPHEAEIALRRCQSLMSKYGISEADLHTSEFGNAEFTKGRTIPSHVKFLASAVARLHDVLFVRGDAGFAEFRGFDVDAKVARMTLEYLIDAVERALANRKRAGDFPAGRSSAYDYRLGFATQVSKRVTEIVKERKYAEQTTADSGTSLTVRKMEIVDRECGHDLRNASFSSSRGARNGTAHAAGIDDGSRVSLDQQVGGSPAPLALPKS